MLKAEAVVVASPDHAHVPYLVPGTSTCVDAKGSTGAFAQSWPHSHPPDRQTYATQLSLSRLYMVDKL